MWAFTTILDFMDEKFMDIRFHNLIGSNEPWLTMPRYMQFHIYVDWVSSVLNQHRASNIELFRVSLVHDSSVMDEWIRFAMRKRVQSLELSDQLGFQNGHYQFSKHVFESSCFKFLKVIDLMKVDVTQDVVEYFIFNCPVLARVTVYHSFSLVALRVVGQSIALKYLTVRGCPNIKSIEIYQVNLISFTYSGDVEILVLRNLPLLVEVCHVETGSTGERAKFDFSYFSCFLSQLESLKILSITPKSKKDPEVPLLPNLKLLELAFDERDEIALLHLSFLLRQTPRLHTLVIKFRSGWSVKRLFAKKRAAKYSHGCLKVVKFVTYSGHSRQIELVKYLIKTASNLEKLILDPVKNRDDRSVFRRLDVRDEELSRAEACQLKEKLPATLDVVCL